jgi:hypothetical protein
MSNLLSIESAFLNLPQVKSAINLSEIKRARRSIENAQKSKFNHTMSMANLVKSAVEWFDSAEGKAVFAEEGVQWSKADFGLKVFGWQKSYFYKVVKVATLDERILAAFNTSCDNLGSEANRSLAGLLEFSRDIDLDSLEHAADATEEQIAEAEEAAIAEAASAVQEERVETMFTMSWKNPAGRNVAIRVDANGQIITQNDSSEVSAAINFLSQAINNTRV